MFNINKAEKIVAIKKDIARWRSLA